MRLGTIVTTIRARIPAILRRRARSPRIVDVGSYRRWLQLADGRWRLLPPAPRADHPTPIERYRDRGVM